MAKVKVNLERSICVGTHGGFLLTIGERDYHDDVAAAIVTAGFGEYTDKPAIVEAVVDVYPVVVMEPEPEISTVIDVEVAPVADIVEAVVEPLIEEKAIEAAPENKMMPEAPQNKRDKLSRKPAKQPAIIEPNEETL